MAIEILNFQWTADVEQRPYGDINIIKFSFIFSMQALIISMYTVQIQILFSAT